MRCGFSGSRRRPRWTRGCSIRSGCRSRAGRGMSVPKPKRHRSSRTGRGLRSLLLALAAATALTACDPQDNTTFEEYLARAQQQRDIGEMRASLIELKNALQKEPQNPMG